MKIWNAILGLSLSVVVSAGLFVSPAIAAVSIGGSPSEITVENAMRNASVFRDMFISRSGELGEMTVVVSFSGDAGQYFRGDPEIIIPEGDSFGTYELEIYPQDAPDGTYTGYVSFVVGDIKGVEDSESVGSGVVITPGVTIIVNFTVQGKEVLDVSVSNFSVTDTEESQPLFVNFDVDNAGNIEWQPSKAEFVIRDKSKEMDPMTVVVEQKDIPKTKAGLLQKMRLSLSPELNEGNYTIEGIFYFRGEKYYRSQRESFEVYEEGHFQRKGFAGKVTLNKEEFVPGEQVKIASVLENIGGVPISGKLVAEIWDETELLEVLSSDPLLVDPGEERELSVFAQAPDFGTYRILSHIEYEGRSTDIEEIALNVPEPVKEQVNVTAYMGIAVGVISFALIGFLIRNLRKEKKSGGKDEEEYIDVSSFGDV